MSIAKQSELGWFVSAVQRDGLFKRMAKKLGVAHPKHAEGDTPLPALSD